MNYQAKKYEADRHNSKYEEKKEKYRLAARLPKTMVTYPLPDIKTLRVLVKAYEEKKDYVEVPTERGVTRLVLLANK